MTASSSPLLDPAADGVAHRLAGMEGLRGLAAASVFGVHLWRYSGPDTSQVPVGRVLGAMLPHLGLGLTLFFALSGFLLYRPFARAITGESSWPVVGRYARNRGLRIFPAYVVILLVVAVVLPGGLLRTADGDLVLGSLRDDPAVLVRNLALIQTLFPSSMLTGIGPAWSLTVELCFYAVLPLVAALGLRVSRRARGRPRPLLAALVPPAMFLAVGWATTTSR